MILYTVWDDNGESHEDHSIEEVYCGLSKDRAEIVAHECRKALCHAAISAHGDRCYSYGAEKHTITIEERDIGEGYDILNEFLARWRVKPGCQVE